MSTIRLISDFLLVSLAAFMFISIVLAIVARRDRMSEPVRWLAVLAICITGIMFAIVIRTLTIDWPERHDWMKVVALLAGWAWPLWRFVKKIRTGSR